MLERGGGESVLALSWRGPNCSGELTEIELDEGPVEIMMSYLQK